MRLFYEAWNVIEPNSPIAIGELANGQNHLMETKKKA
jgi:hypothetical protein